MATLCSSRWFRWLIVLLLVVTLARVEAEAAVWRPGVIEGGSISALARHPANGRIYAAGQRGLVFASDDGGASWVRVNVTPMAINGLFDLAAASGALVGIQQSPRQLLRSTDGGANWTDVIAALGGASPVFVERDVAVPSRLYLGTSAHGLLVSQDSGATWTSLSNGLADGGGQMPSLNGFSQSPARPQTMYASSQSRGLFRSTDGGASWVALEGEPGSPRQIVAHPTLRDTVYMRGFDRVHRSNDRGDSWEQIAQGLFDRLGFSPGGAVLLGLADGVGLLRSTDVGTTFAPVPLEVNPVVLSDLLALPGSPRLLAATTTGVLASSDDGITWSLANDGLSAVLVGDLVVAGGEGTRVYLAHEGGYQRSDDRGATWTRLEPGRVGDFPGRIASSAQSATKVFTTLDGAAGTRVPMSTDGGETWSSPPALAAGFGSTVLAVDGLSDERVVLGVWGDPSFAADFGVPEFAGGLYLSADGGATWQHVYVPDGDAAHFQPTSLVVRGDLIVAGYLGAREDFSFFGAVVHSDDGGATWTEVFVEDAFVFPKLALDPVDPALLYLAGSAEHRLQRSLDGGATWAPLAGLPDSAVFDVATDSARGDIVLVSLPSGGGIYRSTDRGVTWELLPAAPVGEHFRQVASSVDGTIHASTNLGVYTLVPDDEACEGAHRLCLTGDRFLLEVAWKDFEGGSGSGVAESLTPDTGYFWFFDAANVELVVKVLDARLVNGHFWVFYGSLTNVEFRLRVTDRVTGEVVEYHNPSGQFASRGDTAAFAASNDAASSLGMGAVGRAVGLLRARPGANGTCAADATSLCLADGRFRVAVEWEDFQGGSGPGQAVPITPDTGYFWFFDDTNVELVVKVLDARAVNGHFWVFYGALTNVGYTLTVTDTASGDEVTYENPSGTFGSRGDNAAFPD